MDERCLLIIEDDPGLQSQLRWSFDDITVDVADSREQALAILNENPKPVVTLDLGLPPDPGGTTEGFALLREIRAKHPRTKVIVITGRDEQEHAIAAIRDGAYDYYQKPIDSTTLQFAVDRAFFLHEIEVALHEIEESISEPLAGMIGRSAQIQAVADRVKRIAQADVSVLITGETGTGKEIIATNVHALSNRAEGAHITINCAAIPENLLESELFGHEKGSFTGAHQRKIGKVEAANGGTLFLDEIGDMPLPLQAKILRFLQERKFERVGATTSIEADVRIVCATHRNLADMISDGTFREDLYYRLSEIDIALPPLRDRGNDVLLIAERFLSDHCNGRTLKLSDDAVVALMESDWPGNVRELENRVRRAAILCDGGEITAADLELEPEAREIEVEPLKVVRARAEGQAIEAALVKSKDNLSEASRLLGVSRPTLYGLLEKYEIPHGKG